MMKTIQEQVESKKSEIFFLKGVLNNLDGVRSCLMDRGERDMFKFTGMQKELYVKRIKVLEAEIEKMVPENSTWCFDNTTLDLLKEMGIVCH
jgi:hypothetical protein